MAGADGIAGLVLRIVRSLVDTPDAVKLETFSDAEGSITYRDLMRLPLTAQLSKHRKGDVFVEGHWMRYLERIGKPSMD